MMKRPEDPADIIVFITMMFGSIILYATLAVHAFINRDEIRMIKVPATKNEMFWFENCRFIDALYMSNIIRISLLLNLLNSGC